MYKITKNETVENFKSPLIGLSLIVCFISIIVYLIFARNYELVAITSFEWKRTVNIETFKTVHYYNVSYRKSGAYNVRKWDAGYYVPSYDYEGKFSGMEWNEVIRYEYDLDEWVFLIAYNSSGDKQNPKWPDYSLKPGPLNQLDRVGSTEECYKILVSTKDGSIKEFTTDEKGWLSFEIGEQVRATLNIFGWVLALDREHISD